MSILSFPKASLQLNRAHTHKPRTTHSRLIVGPDRISLHPPSPSPTPTNSRRDSLCQNLLPASQEVLVARLFAALDGGRQLLLATVHVLLQVDQTQDKVILQLRLTKKVH